MTKIKSAHSICSGDNGTTGSSFNPAESTSTSGCVANTVSAVGLLNLFRAHTNKIRLITCFCDCASSTQLLHIQQILQPPAFQLVRD